MSSCLSDSCQYLEWLVPDEGEERDGSFGVPPGTRLAGSAQDLPVPEANTELQSHIGRRFTGCPTAARQGDIEPDGGTSGSHGFNGGGHRWM